MLLTSDPCDTETCSSNQQIIECNTLTIDDISISNIKCKIDDRIYALKSKIGLGYFASVYMAISENNNEKVAIKFQFDLKSEHTFREIEALLDIQNKLQNKHNYDQYKFAKLIDYSPQNIEYSSIVNDKSTIKCIVAVFHYYNNGDMPHFLENYQLKQDKKRRELFGIQSTIKYLDQISFILEILNEELKITHCDVKDGNILIEYDHFSDNIDFYLCDFALIHPINEIHPCGAPMFWPKEMYDYMSNDNDEKYIKNKQDLLDIVGLNAVAILWYAKLCDNNTLIVSNDGRKEYVFGDGINQLCVGANAVLKYYDESMSDGLQWGDVESMISTRQYMIISAVEELKSNYMNTIEYQLAKLFQNHVNTYKKKKWKSFRKQLSLITDL